MNANLFQKCSVLFLNRSKHNGINLSQKQLKSLFITYVSQKESHMQQSFQLHHDLGYAGDHTHKFSKQITCTNRPDKIFTASCTIVSMLGKVASSRLTFTKSNEELDPILLGLTKLRSNMRLQDAKRHETDDATGDGNLWKKHFPELRKDVVEHVLPNSNLGFACINDQDCIHISSMNALNNWSMSVTSSIDTSSAMLVGIDCEWNYRDGSVNLTRTLQLSFPNHKVSVVHLSKLSIFTPATFPPTLKNLLELENLLFCGRNVSIDCNRMEALGVQLLKRFELRDAALHDDPDMNGTSLENLASNYLGLSLNKSHRDEDFSAHPLPIHLQRYSALDALVSRKLGEVIKLKHQNVNNDIPETLHLEVGDNVNYIIGSKVSASGTLTFVSGNGLQTRYGGTTVGANKALFQIEHIKIPNSKPSSITNKFYTSNLTMKDIALHVNPPIIIVRTSSIEKSLPVDESYSLICNNLQ